MGVGVGGNWLTIHHRDTEGTEIDIAEVINLLVLVRIRHPLPPQNLTLLLDDSDPQSKNIEHSFFTP